MNNTIRIESAKSLGKNKSVQKSQDRVHITGPVLLHPPKVKGNFLNDEFSVDEKQNSYYQRFKNSIGLVPSTHYSGSDWTSAFGGWYGLSKGYTGDEGPAGQAWEDHQAKLEQFNRDPAFKAIKKKFGRHAWQKRSGKRFPGSRSLAAPVDVGTNYGIARYGRNGYHLLMSKFSTPFALTAEPKDFFNSDLYEPSVNGRAVLKSELPQDKNIMGIKIRDKRTGEIKKLHDLPELHDFAYSVDVASRHIPRFESSYQQRQEMSLQGVDPQYLPDPLKCNDCKLRHSPSGALKMVTDSRDNLLSTLSNYEPHPNQQEEWDTLHHILKNGELDFDDTPSRVSLGNLETQGAGKTYEGHNLDGGGPQQLIIRGWNAPRMTTKTAGKIPIGYKSKSDFICLHCIHHKDIIHDGYKPTTRGNPKNCIRCGEQDN